MNSSQHPDGQSQWQRRYEHYVNLAQQSGSDDHVTRELHWQHAEYFRRLLNGSGMHQA